MSETLSQVAINNYYGGDNPLLVYLTIALIFTTLCVSAYFLLKSFQRLRQYNEIVDNAQLNSQELGLLKTWIKRLHIKDKLTTVTSHNAFDDFINRIAHRYRATNLSEEQLPSEFALFAALRKKLHLDHSYKKKQLTSSRCLPENHPLYAVFHDPSTGEKFSFSSHVILNTEFYLGITPPNAEISAQVFGRPNQGFEISFIRSNDFEYHFESRLVRSVNYPHLMWYIEHSRQLEKGERQMEINLPATVMFAPNDTIPEGLDIDVSITSLGSKDCLICTNQEIPKEDHYDEDEDNTLILTFTLGDQPMSCSGRVVESRTRDEKDYHRVTFNELAKDEQVALHKFVMSMRKQKNVKIGSQK